MIFIRPCVCGAGGMRQQWSPVPLDAIGAAFLFCDRAHVSGVSWENPGAVAQEAKLRSDIGDLRLELAEMTRQAEENKEHDAALDDLLKHKQELIQERDNQVNAPPLPPPLFLKP
jgi:hypothetical protein